MILGQYKKQTRHVIHAITVITLHQSLIHLSSASVSITMNDYIGGVFLSIDIWLHSAEPPPSNTNQAVDDTSHCLKAWRCSWCSDCSVWCGALALLQGSWCSALRWCLFVFWSLVYLGFQVHSWLEDRTCRSSPPIQTSKSTVRT